MFHIEIASCLRVKISHFWSPKMKSHRTQMVQGVRMPCPVDEQLCNMDSSATIACDFDSET